METKANFLLIGAFTLLGFLGLLGFAAWFSKAELDKNYAYYDIYFENVTGLAAASTVKYAGLPVGQVIDLKLAERADGSIRVRIEIDPDVPLTAASIAKVESQGVTGLSYVGLEQGEGGARLPIVSNGTASSAPTLTAGRSTLQVLASDAPKIIERALEVMDRINAIADDENQALLDEIMQNLASSSARLNQTLSDFSSVAANVGSSVQEIASFTSELDGLSQSVESTLSVAEHALTSIDGFANKATETLDAGTTMIHSADETITLAGAFIDTELAALVTDVTVTSAQLRQDVEQLAQNANGTLKSWKSVGDEAASRFAEAQTALASVESTLDAMKGTLESVTKTSDQIGALTEGEAAALVTDLRGVAHEAQAALSPITELAQNGIPEVFAQLSKAVSSFEATIAEVEDAVTDEESGLSALSLQGIAGLREAEISFARARETMDTLDQTLSRADTALDAASGAFTGAERMVNQDLGPIAADLGDAISRFNAAMDQVNADIPDISGSLRSAASRADATVGRLSALTRDIEGPLSRFANEGLTRYTSVAREAERLVALLSSIATKIERNPSRFILGGETPTYRRR